MQHKVTQLVQLPLTTHAWDAFVEIFVEHGVPAPSAPDAVFLVGTPSIVGGVCAYYAGPYVLVEHFALERYAAPMLKLRATHMLAKLVRAHCAALGKDIVMAARGKGLQHVLLAHGFRFSPARAMHCATSQWLLLVDAPAAHHTPPEPRPAKEKKKVSSRVRKRNNA